LTYRDLAEALQARLSAHLKADCHTLRDPPDSDGQRRIETLEVEIAVLQSAIAATEALGEQQRQEAGMAAKRVAALQAQLVTLEHAVATAQTLADQRRVEAETAIKRIEVLEAHFAQVAIGINLAIMMADGHIAGFDVKRLQGIANSIAALRSAS
jgi:chromosome segregation ATPase